MMGQTEGISLRESSIQGYVSSEQISAVITIPPKLFMFNFEQFLSSSTVTSKETQGLVTMQCYPNPSQSKVFISNYKGEFQLYDAISGRLIYEGTYKNQGVDLSALSIGIYLLKTSHTSFKIVKIY